MPDWLKIGDRQPRRDGAEVFPVDAYAISDTGQERRQNQDNLGLLHLSGGRDMLAVLADGMGGHRGGEVASRLAVETVINRFGNCRTGADCPQALAAAIATANETVFRLAQSDRELSGMGTTLALLALIDGHAYYANCGDSRIYRIRGGRMAQLSEDHTQVAQMVADGLLSAEAARRHPMRNIVTRAVGSRPEVRPAVGAKPLRLEAGDVFVLCSDGLYDTVSDREIADMAGRKPARPTCEALVRLANDRGGFDNISVIVIGISDRRKQAEKVPVTRV